jgi:hypothetical protein
LVVSRGTDGSNPLPSSGESDANPDFLAFSTVTNARPPVPTAWLGVIRLPSRSNSMPASKLGWRLAP